MKRIWKMGWRRVGTGGAALIILSAGACSDTDPSGAAGPPMPTFQDSLGVTIVQHTALDGADTTSWRIEWEDTVRIGRAGLEEGDPAYHFGRAAGALRLRDGRIAVADALAHTIRVFRPDGVLDESIGGEGEGPGEFTELGGLLRVEGDSIAVLTRRAGWTLLDPAGRFVRRERLDMSHWPGVIYPTIHGAFADGSLLVTYSPESESRSEPLEWGSRHEGITRFYRVDRSGTMRAEFGTFPRGVTFLAEGGDVGLEYPFVFFSRGPGPHHTANGGRFYRTDEAIREVRVFRDDGSLERIVRMDRETLRSDAEPSFAGESDVDLHAGVRTVLEEERAAIGVGPFQDFTVDREGWLWLREQRGRSDDRSVPARWYVFDPRGVLRHVVRLPYRWASMGGGGLTIGTDYILAKERDELDVETYVLMGLRRE